ncbi:MAG: hypothetical protein Q7J34_11730 [Bacteroidales bacterium]|nr:hypothetical protein [Bacteroidales bacterium]
MRNKLHIIWIVCLLSVQWPTWGQTITISINLSSTQLNVSSSLITEAGNDYQISAYEDCSVCPVLFVSGYANKDMRVDVRKSDMIWSSSLAILVRRTAIATGITGGTTFQTITNSDQYFFTVVKNTVNWIPIAFRVQNFSVLNGSGNLSTNVIFTVSLL